MTFDGCVTGQFAPLFHCDLHESGMSCKKVMHVAAQAQGFVKVTRLRCSFVGICNFRVVFWRC